MTTRVEENRKIFVAFIYLSTMNNQLIEKVIKSNDNACPVFTYDSALLDLNIANAFARSFVKILRDSQQDSTISINLRHTVLANIRQLCRIEPENHLEIDETFTNSLAEMYLEQINDTQRNNTVNSIEGNLDEFLLRNLKELDLNPRYQCSMNPEVVQALLNLTENKSKLELLTNKVLHWNVTDLKTFTLVKNLWNDSSLTEIPINFDDISIKMKSEIEIILLNLCHKILTDPNIQIEEMYSSNNDLKNLVKKCSISAECCQICIAILNYLFIHTNYNIDIQIFISNFIQNVKQNCRINSISVLYPVHLRPIIVLLDIDLDVLSHQLKNNYVKQTIAKLKSLDNKVNNDLVLLLSHFPKWFDIYF